MGIETPITSKQKSANYLTVSELKVYVVHPKEPEVQLHNVDCEPFTLREGDEYPK